MRIIALSCATLLSSASLFAAAVADDAPAYTPGPWHFRSVTCADTKVEAVTPRASDTGKPPFTAAQFDASGVAVSYATTLGLAPLFAKRTAAVVHYQGTGGNDVMRAEKRGDRVQVCFLGGPGPTIGCDPDTDSRGRQYRVWDYARNKQYVGFNSEHLCGGA